VTAITSYSSIVNPATRTLTVNATVDTLYGGEASLSVLISPGSAPKTLVDKPVATTTAPTATLRVRKMDPVTGDYVLTGHREDYLVNSASAVGQIVMTRLRLWQGEFHLDTSEGTPYLTSLGQRGQRVNMDALIRDRILSTPGVTAIDSYSSTLDSGTRVLSVAATIQTLYGATTVQAAL
jgi:hypothetical protein